MILPTTGFLFSNWYAPIIEALALFNQTNIISSVKKKKKEYYEKKTCSLSVTAVSESP